MNLSRTVIVDSVPGDDLRTAVLLMISQIQELDMWQSYRPKLSDKKVNWIILNKPDKSDMQQQNRPEYHDEYRLFDGVVLMGAIDVVTLNLTFST